MELIRGIGASPYIRSGRVKKIESFKDMESVEGGEIIVTARVSRDMLPKLKRVGAVVTDYGGLTSHVAITLRELKIPCVVGTEKATEILEDDMVVTVDGKTGNIYEGVMEWEEIIEELPLEETSTTLMTNLNIPSIADRIADYADGIGSVRIEHMVIETGKHPYRLLEEGMLTDVLKKGLEFVLESFYPKPVWFRTFDIPTDELRNLQGGDVEPEEPNPLLGFRGIYKDLRDLEVLKAEFMAIKELIDDGYSNLGLKFPFVRDENEYLSAKRILKECGLRPHHDLEVGLSVETPSAALQIREFIGYGLDFVSIGMSDLAMCTLAVDRRGVKVAKLFDLTHPALLGLVDNVIRECSRAGIKTCVAGYAATDYNIVEKLIRMGVDGISTNPDQLLKMRVFITRIEKSILLETLRGG